MNDTTSTEAADLLATLAAHRRFLRTTVAGLDDEQAASHPTASELCLGGVIKHVAATEKMWAKFMVEGADAFPAFPSGEGDWDAGSGGDSASGTDEWGSEFLMLPGETLSGYLADYEAVAAATDELVATVDLNSSHPLPAAPWFEPGAEWSARRVALHIIAETAQHAGHADILRESIDGSKTMG